MAVVRRGDTAVLRSAWGRAGSADLHNLFRVTAGIAIVVLVLYMVGVAGLVAVAHG